MVALSYSFLVVTAVMPLLAATATGHMTVGHARSGLEQLVVVRGWAGRYLDFWAGVCSTVFNSDSICLAPGHGPIPNPISNAIGSIVNVVSIPIRHVTLDLCLGGDVSVAIFQ